MRYIPFYIIFVTLLFSNPVFSEEAQQLTPYLQPPEIEKIGAPVYPGNPEKTGEGWVEVLFMVDKEGKTFEPWVVDSVGSDRFVKSALNTLKKAKYNPASINGEVVEGSSTNRFSFWLSDDSYRKRGATRTFISEREKFLEALENKNFKLAETILENLKQDIKYLYEDAYLGIMEDQLGVLQSNPFVSEAGLNRASRHINLESNITIFSNEEAIDILYLKFVNKVQLGKYHEAVSTFDEIKSLENTEDLIDQLTPAVSELNRLIDSNEPIYSLGKIASPDSGWSITLVRSEFSFVNIEGRLKQVKLRCPAGFTEFFTETNKIYSFDENLGECHLQAIGEAGTTFQLVQH